MLPTSGLSHHKSGHKKGREGIAAPECETLIVIITPGRSQHLIC